MLAQHSKHAPNWFDEGFGGYFEGLQSDPYGDAVDDLHQEYLGTVRREVDDGTACPLDVLMEIKDIDYYGFAGARNVRWSKPSLYAQSWSIVHFLLTSPGEEVEEFEALVLRRVTTGRWSKGPLRRALVEVTERWRAHLAREDLGLIGDWMTQAWESMAEERYRGARMTASRVLGVDEHHRSARRVLAHACFAENDHEAALVSFERLLDDRPDDVDARLGATRSLVAIARATQTAETVEAAIASGQAASEIAPEPMRHVGLALCADAAEIVGDTSRALDFVREALRIKELPDVARTDLQAREQELVQRAIGKQ